MHHWGRRSGQTLDFHPYTLTRCYTVKTGNYSRPGRVWLVTSRLGTGKSLTFFLQCRGGRPEKDAKAVVVILHRNGKQLRDTRRESCNSHSAPFTPDLGAGRTTTFGLVSFKFLHCCCFGCQIQRPEGRLVLFIRVIVPKMNEYEVHRQQSIS